MALPRKGRYQIKGKLGEGGMGVVFRAYDPPPMDRDVALKTLPAFADPLALELFYKECRVLKSISHPNVVEIFDMGECEDGGRKKPFFVMPLLRGQTLEDLIRTASHRLTVPRVVEIIAQTCRGLQAAHEHGLIHRDLKPSNIFVMADDSVKIIDFGVAHAIDARSRTSGYAKGTLLYMAPEQVQHKPVSPQSDIFSLGVVCYEGLTRRQPFRGATEEEIAGAILTCIPPPASDINPAASQTISRVVHKAIAKHPWNRYDSVREFGDTLQKALRNEPIALFDPARIQPRLQRASRALEGGDCQFAGEIVGELEAEGNIDPRLTLLRTQIDQVARQKTIAQLLESARARYEEDEDPLALQKLQEVLRLDPSHAAALGLKSKIDERRSERQIEQWVQLARQHVDNHSYDPARDAVQNVLSLRPNDTRATKLLKKIEAEEQDYLRLRREKAEIYQAALNAWKNGDVSHALSQMKIVLDLDRRAPDTSSPETGATYQVFYNKVRSEHDAIGTAYAEARRHLVERHFSPALQICDGFLARYPGHALFQALRFDIQEQERQQLSAFIADVDRRLDAEPDLDAKVSLLREAISRYPDEVHFRRPLQLIEDRRDLVNSIVACARVHEERGELSEALSDLEVLQTIYSPYPGLTFEQERLQKRLDQQARNAAKAGWVSRIDRQLQVGEHSRALELLTGADGEFPDDPELRELRRLAEKGLERASRAEQLYVEGQEQCARGELDIAVETFGSALQLDDRPGIRAALRDLLVERAQTSLEHDWRHAKRLADRALELDPAHALARSVTARALDAEREELVTECAAQARRLQIAGDLAGAVAELERAVTAHPAESRLTSLLETLRSDLEGGSRGRVAQGEPSPAASPAAAPTVTIVRSRPSAVLQQEATVVASQVVPRPSRWRARVASATRALSWRAVARCAAAVVLVAAALAARELRRTPPARTAPPKAEAPADAPSDAATKPMSPPGVLRIVSPDLEGRDVWVDDRHAGSIENGTFMLDELSAGRHLLKIAGAGSALREISIAFVSDPDEPPRVTGIAAPAQEAVIVSTHAGSVRLQSSLEEVAVAVDGQHRGTVNAGALEIAGLAQGIHELTLDIGSGARKTSFAVGDRPALDVILLPGRSLGSILVVADQNDVSVFLDGRAHPERMRNGRLRISNIAAARHTVSVAKDGFKPSEVRTVHVARNREVVVRFALAAVVRPAALVIEDATPGARVSLDDVLIGTVSGERRLTRQDIAPGAHTLLLTLDGYEPRRISREFGAGATVVLSGTDAVLQPVTGTLDIAADPTTDVAISQAGEIVRRVRGSSRLSLTRGSYTVVAQTASGISRSATVALSGGDARTLDFRNMAAGLELFDAPGRWTKDGPWFTRKGGGFVLYDRARPAGRFSFTVRRSRTRNPFAGGWRVRWVVAFTDPRNYVLLQMDDKHCYRSEVIDGKTRQLHRSAHGMPQEAEFVYVSLDLMANRLVQHVSVNGREWRVVDSWTAPVARGPVDGNFGFYLPGNDEIRISNFTFSPAAVR